MRTGRICCCILTAVQLSAADRDSGNSWDQWMARAEKLHVAGKLTEAAESGKHALALAKGYGVSDSRLPLSHFLLGAIYRDWGHCGESRANFARAVNLWLHQDGVNPRWIFNSIEGLITEASECEDYAAAEKLFRTHEAALQRTRSGPTDDAKLLALRAGIALGRKKWKEGEAGYRRAIEILEHLPEVRPVDVAEIRSSLSVILSLQRRFAESLVESEASIAALEKVNPRFVTLPAALNNQACTLFYLGRKEESQRLYRRALELATELFGEDNRNTAKIMLNYAALLRQNKETPAAEAWQEKGNDAYVRTLVRENQTVDVKDLGK